jgi:chemotaxis protein MotB
MKKSNFLLIVVISIALTSCVSLGKFRNIETSLMSSETNLLKEKEEIRQLENDTTELRTGLRSCEAAKKELEEYNAYSQSMLYKEMNKQNSSLDDKNQLISGLQRDLKKTEAELKTQSAGLDKSSAQLTKVEALIKAQKALIVDLRLSAGQITAGFEGQNVDFVSKNGQVIVIVPEQILFGTSSSTKLTTSGETSILSLANVLTQNTRFEVLVEVHSDDNPKRDNWDFTARRAANITELMIKGGVYPGQVKPSGRAQFSPVVENSTEENKARNRRVEIILTPNSKYINDLLKMY